MSVNILGISCSLRNARFGAGSKKLIDELHSIDNESELIRYLSRQTQIRVKEFLDAGRKENKPFNEIYRNLKKSRGEQGLSNSEAALAAGLWGALRTGAQIAHLGLSTYFPANGKSRNLKELRDQILDADGLLLSGPVYFGDRSSIAQAFIEFLHADTKCAQHIKGRLYAGIAVGAKRNGGQETTLIYQMVDLTNMFMLAVGNDDKTTSQYGGTAKAGDVGSLPDDEYGIETSIGTGFRIASVAKMQAAGKKSKLKDKIRISLWLLQDNKNHYGRDLLEKFCIDVEKGFDRVKFQIQDFTEEPVERCIACDVCPTAVGPIDKYRCIIKSAKDTFVYHHNELINTDAILLCAYSPIERVQINSVYQQFIERTRYLRRDDYALGDRLVAPLVISEVGSNQNLHIRMMTSLIRHQCVVHHPLIAMEHNGKLLNWDSLINTGVNFASMAVNQTIGRIMENELHSKSYNPIGYEISTAKRKQDQAEGYIDIEHKNREKKYSDEHIQRII